jgi:hypothetical protein
MQRGPYKRHATFAHWLLSWQRIHGPQENLSWSYRQTGIRPSTALAENNVTQNVKEHRGDRRQSTEGKPTVETLFQIYPSPEGREHDVPDENTKA